MTDDGTSQLSFRTSNEFAHRDLLPFFALACGISWLIWAPLWLPAFGVNGLHVFPFHHAFGAVGPIAAAFVLTLSRGGMAGVHDLLCRMVVWRGRMRWLLIALLAPFVLLAISIVVASLLQHTPTPPSTTQKPLLH